uniref:Uncharacterized protein n=1 Tax=Panagrolaimus sp. ES5 TaxID=591445 RepID=A0AC34FP71_9BILA
MPPYSLPSDEEDVAIQAAPIQRISEQFIQVNIAALRPGIFIGPNATVERVIPAPRPLGYCLLCHANNHETYQCIRARRLRLPPTTITSNQRRDPPPPPPPSNNNPRGPSSAV